MTDVVTGVSKEDLEQLSGYVEEATKSQYEVKRLRNQDHLLILYSSGKLVVQGKNSPFTNTLTKTSKKQSLPLVVPELTSCIGSDETLKGDTFGGIIVTAAYFSADEVDLKDSKSYTDDQIMIVAQELLETYPDRFYTKALIPEEYNLLYEQLRSQTALLNLLHKEVGAHLKKTFNEVQVVDKYPGCTVGDYQVERAESAYTSVAAASIVARYYAIKQFHELSKKAGFLLPKGSTHVREAIITLRQEQADLGKFGKLHFATMH